MSVDIAKCLRDRDKPLLARLFRPRGKGSFPGMVELHGGAWCMSDRLADTVINEPLAKSGVVVAGLDFSMPADAPYPASMGDINYRVRWLKAHPGPFGCGPNIVGIGGKSCGADPAGVDRTSRRPVS